MRIDPRTNLKRLELRRRRRLAGSNAEQPFWVLERAAWYRTTYQNDPDPEFRKAMMSACNAWIATARALPAIPLP